MRNSLISLEILAFPLFATLQLHTQRYGTFGFTSGNTQMSLKYVCAWVASQ